MIEDALRFALAPRTAQAPQYEMQNQIGRAAWELAERMVAARNENMLGVAGPSHERQGAFEAVSALPGPERGSVLQPRSGLPPPEPERGLSGFDAIAVANAAERVDSGPPLDDFQRLGTLPGYGDPALDPHAVNLRNRLTALIRSA